MESLESAFADVPRPRGPTPASVPGHDVHFYRTEAHLIDTAVGFLAAGVRAGQPLIVIATEAHRTRFQEELQRLRLDPEEYLSDRSAAWLDARETLDSFMERGHPNRELFFATVGAVFENVLRKRHYLLVRGYGEMVDLLVADGNADAAIEVEALWNELGRKYPYSLLCGYSLGNFVHESGASSLRRICELHTTALPIERDDAMTR